MNVTRLTTILVFLVLLSIAHGSIVLKINGLDPAVSPLELSSPQSLELSLRDSELNNASYDLILAATGGEFSYDGSKSSSLTIQTSDLEHISTIDFQFIDDPGTAVISLTTNQSLAIGGEIVPGGTEVYQLFLFDMQADNKVVVFGVDYESLTYENTSAYETIETITAEPTETMIADSSSQTALDNESLLFGDPNELCYLTGQVVWEGEIFLDRPVYVYDANGIGASLEIKPGSSVIPIAADAGIYLAQGSSLKARNVYFGPMPEYFSFWKGIVIEGEPVAFVFDENEMRAAEIGLWLRDYQYASISNSVFKWCNDGIIAFPGTVQIHNCVFDDSYWTGISYYMETPHPEDPNIIWDPNDPNSIGDPNSFVSDAIAGSGLYVDNCTITGSFYNGYAHDCGVFVYGTNRMEDACRFEVSDCLITSSCIEGIHQEGWQSAVWRNNAFYHNFYVTNPGNPFEDPNSIYIPDDPYYDPFDFYVDNGYEEWDMLYFLWSQSELIDAGSTHVFAGDLLGKTTLFTGEPDRGMADIGYHYPNRGYCNEGILLNSDMNGDNFVNLVDFYTLACNWGCSLDPNDWPTTDPNDPLYYEPNALADISGDGLIGLDDLMNIADEWLLEGTGQEGKGTIHVLLNGTPLQATSLSVSGRLEFGFEFLNISEGNIIQLVIQRDGQTVMTLDADEGNLIDRHYIEKSWRLDGEAKYVFLALLDNEDFIVSRPYHITFDNEISLGSDLKYSLDGDLAFSVRLKEDNFYTLGIFNALIDPNDPNDPLSSALYTQEFSSSGDIVIPKEVFADDLQLYGLQIYQTPQETEGGQGGYSVFAAGSLPTLEDLITFDLNSASEEYWYYTRAIISVGNSELEESKIPKIMLQETCRDLHPSMHVVYIGPDTIDKRYAEHGKYANLFTVGHWIHKATLWYHFSHGSNQLKGEKPRQVCHFGNQKVFSHLWDDYNDETRPTGLEKLQLPWHKNCRSLRSLLLYDAPKGAVIFDGCSHGATNEIPEQLGTLGTHQPPGGSIFVGWRGEIPMYDNPITQQNMGQYFEYRKLLAEAWTSKITFGSARDTRCEGLLWGHDMRDNLYITGADAYTSHWCTPDISDTQDHR